jgi:hypothetical protein
MRLNRSRATRFFLHQLDLYFGCIKEPLSIKFNRDIMRAWLIFLVVLWQTPGHGQSDYIVLRAKAGAADVDTVFGTVNLPEDGVFSGKVKINTKGAEEKFKTKNIRCLRAANLHFASIRFGASYAIVPRIMHGPLELYFFYTGFDRLAFIPIEPELFTGDVSYDDQEPAEGIWNRTSNFYLSKAGSDVFFEVPKSQKKFQKETPEFFKDNDTLYKRIIDEEFEPNQIPLMVALYNKAVSGQGYLVGAFVDGTLSGYVDSTSGKNQGLKKDDAATSADTITVTKTFGGYHFYQGSKILRWNQLLSKMESNEDAYWQMNSARNSKVLADVVGGLGGFALGWTIGTALAGGEASGILVIVGVGLIVTSIPITQSSYRKAKHAVRMYNNGLPTSYIRPKAELKLAATSNGLGLIWNF